MPKLKKRPVELVPESELLPDIRKFRIGRSTLAKLRKQGVIVKGLHWFKGESAMAPVLYDKQATIEALTDYRMGRAV